MESYILADDLNGANPPEGLRAEETDAVEEI